MPVRADVKNDRVFVRLNVRRMARKEQEKKAKTKERVHRERGRYERRSKTNMVGLSLFATLHLSFFNEAMPLNLSHTNSNKRLEVESNKFLKLFTLLQRIPDECACVCLARTHRTCSRTFICRAKLFFAPFFSSRLRLSWARILQTHCGVARDFFFSPLFFPFRSIHFQHS